MTDHSLIEVLFKDGARGRVAPKALDLFLRFEEIAGFRRSTGWVRVGVDPVRSRESGTDYAGPERRAA